MSVRHVLAQADVAHQQQAGHFALDGARRLLHDAVVGPGAGGDFVLRLRQAEEDDAGNAQRLHLGALLHRFVDRQVVHPGHGAHFLANAFAGTDEQRIDKAFRAEAGFADKRAHRFVATQAAGTINWKCHNSKILAPRRAAGAAKFPHFFLAASMALRNSEPVIPRLMSPRISVSWRP